MLSEQCRLHALKPLVLHHTRSTASEPLLTSVQLLACLQRRAHSDLIWHLFMMLLQGYGQCIYICKQNHLSRSGDYFECLIALTVDLRSILTRQLYIRDLGSTDFVANSMKHGYLRLKKNLLLPIAMQGRVTDAGEVCGLEMHMRSAEYRQSRNATC